MPHRSTCVSSTAFVSANHFPAVCKIDQNCLNIKYRFKSALHCAPPPKSAQIRPKPGRWRRRREREPGPCTERPWPCGLRHAAVDVLGRSTASPSRPRLAGAFPDSKRDVQRSNQSIYASLLSLPSLRSLSKFTIPIEKEQIQRRFKNRSFGGCAAGFRLSFDVCRRPHLGAAATATACRSSSQCMVSWIKLVWHEGIAMKLPIGSMYGIYTNI